METIVNDPSAFAQGSPAPYTYGAKFRGHDLKVLQTKPLALSGPFASCYGPNSTPSYTMFQMRADVRRFLPLQYTPAATRRANVW